MADGKAGAPLGNNNAAKAKQWTAAIERALDKRGLDRKQSLDVLAEKFLAKCDEGEPWAFKELGDRLEGKPMQSVEMNVTRNTADMADSELARVIAESSSSRATRKANGKKESNSVH